YEKKIPVTKDLVQQLTLALQAQIRGIIHVPKFAALSACLSVIFLNYDEIQADISNIPVWIILLHCIECFASKNDQFPDPLFDLLI
ncbi:hypothetical protein OFM36_35430, partial [Escherichia coli]|nr:hypothetical protein [Escherichia coli]